MSVIQKKLEKEDTKTTKSKKLSTVWPPKCVEQNKKKIRKVKGMRGGGDNWTDSNVENLTAEMKTRIFIMYQDAYKSIGIHIPDQNSFFTFYPCSCMFLESTHSTPDTPIIE